MFKRSHEEEAKEDVRKNTDDAYFYGCFGVVKRIKYLNGNPDAGDRPKSERIIKERD
jgi:hypothetical protein